MDISRIVDFMMVKNVFRSRNMSKKAKLVEWDSAIRVLKKDCSPIENVSLIVFHLNDYYLQLNLKSRREMLMILLSYLRVM